jgi:hypothetical protein
MIRNVILFAGGFLLLSCFWACTRKDAIAPYARLYGSADTAVLLNSGPFTDPGLHAKDETDGLLNPIVTGSVNTDSTALYEIVYRIVDNSHNETRLVRKVLVGNEAADRAGRYDVTKTCSDPSQDAVYTDIVTASSLYNNELVVSHFANYANSYIKVLLQEDNKVLLRYQEFVPQDPGLSKVLFYEATGTSLSDGFTIDFSGEEIDTSDVPVRTPRSCTVLYKKQ